MVLNLAFSLGNGEKCWVALCLALKSLKWTVFNDLDVEAVCRSVLLRF